MSETNDFYEAFRHLENLPEEQQRQIEEKFNKATGSNLPFDALAKTLSEIDMDYQSFKEMMVDWKISYINNVKKEILSSPDYFEWMKEYISKNKRLAGYHRRKDDITIKERNKIDNLKCFYDGINEYARSNNYASYEFDEIAKGYYFIEYYDSIIGIALYQFDNTVVCQIMDSDKLKKSGIKTIDFNSVIKYYENLNLDKESERKR